jgi:hypothetical protein
MGRLRCWPGFMIRSIRSEKGESLGLGLEVVEYSSLTFLGCDAADGLNSYF